MKQTFLHRPGLEIEADFSHENPPMFRYRLSATTVGASAAPRTVCAIMQNPSYACVEFADKSVQVLERVVFEKDYREFQGVERLVVVNQFAFIQTNGFVGTDDQIGARNEVAIDQAIEQAEIVLVAWGKDNGYMQRQNDIIRIIQDHRGKSLLQTSRHPSRVIYDGFIQEFST
ncbi:DUF1643 domain-containing protein [uncultured Thiodictyon sp.]|uniref:DUF1643 domain-containing protein n=1 Tax=uncultured Thiodictyon sp. TaxID=1846217 RepID=UPI0025EB9953|nr:DUF1643 domain-containing protein [uncultured Thiodictyon sp.]